MHEAKGILLSKAFWGNIIAILGAVLGLSQIEQKELLDNAALIIAIVGSVLSIYGRVKAKSRIKGMTKRRINYGRVFGKQ